MGVYGDSSCHCSSRFQRKKEIEHEKAGAFGESKYRKPESTSKDTENHMALGMSLGMSLGMCLGTVLSTTGIVPLSCFGMLIGAIVGVCIKRK
ncbi:MAG TPA: hypothetical protein VN512_08615 [Clostridia bacterium]|nr:hypothetical protein [Clostridia bacterium]